MSFGYFILSLALIISAIAAYYSIVGLAAIFAAAAIPVIVMASALEAAKISTTVWLHQNWNRSRKFMRSYLIAAVVVLMLITSMGIFGFLSRAHIEQTSAASSNVEKISRIESEIARQEEIRSRAEAEIASLASGLSKSDASIQDQIDREQKRIEAANARIQPAIDEQNKIINTFAGTVDNRISDLRTAAADASKKISDLDAALASGDVKLAQAIVGIKQDGNLGANTQRAIQQYREMLIKQQSAAERKINQALKSNDPRVEKAREEIVRIRSSIEQEVKNSNELIARLRGSLQFKEDETKGPKIAHQEEIVAKTVVAIDALIQEKYSLQDNTRKLEAEVGPLKYIAEMIYEEADEKVLEKAVRWVIIAIIIVFDPLAIMLVLAGIESLGWERQAKLEAQKRSENELVTEPTNVSETPEPVPEPVAEIPEPVKEEILEDTVPVKEEISEQVIVETRVETPEPVAEEPVKQDDPEPIVEQQTHNVIDVAPDYVMVDGKTFHRRALAAAIPEITLKAGDKENLVNFGTKFPEYAKRGTLFLRVDFQPTKLFKFSGEKWIEEDKTDSYSFSEEYIKVLIDKIAHEKYDPRLLSKEEQAQIEDYLQSKNTDFIQE